MSAIEYIALIISGVGGIATAFFAWRGKKEDTTQKHDDAVSEMFTTQGELVKELSGQVAKLSQEIGNLRLDNSKLTEENEALRAEVRKMTTKIDELMRTV